MMQKLPTSALIAFLAAMLFCTSSQAEQSSTFGDYTIHYIAVGSNFLDPDIARQYDITRGPRRAFLNISVIRENPDGSTTPVTAKVSGTKNNLLQQSEQISFKEINEGAAIYYIGEFVFSEAENLRFEIDVQPEQQGSFHHIEWNTTLYTN